MDQYTPQQRAAMDALIRGSHNAVRPVPVQLHRPMTPPPQMAQAAMPQQGQLLPGMVPGARPSQPTVQPQGQSSWVDSVGEKFGQTPLGSMIKSNLPDLYYGFGEAMKGKSPMRARPR